MTFRALRQRAGFSQGSLSASTRRRVRQETISQIERGDLRDPRSSTLLALSAALAADVLTVYTAIQRTRRRRARRLR